jgi:predicted O-methyltransferase YrrM
MNDPEQKPQRRLSHGELIERLIAEHREDFGDGQPVFVETGCGISTLYLARAARRCGARVFSCDKNLEKIEALKAKAGEDVANVEFIIGDSLRSLATLRHRHHQIHFLSLGAAASSMLTFLEFEVVKSVLRPGSILLLNNSVAYVENAGTPSAKRAIASCRRGQILAYYLMASAYWQAKGVHDGGHGDSFIYAVRRKEGRYTNQDYEWPEYVDPWQWSFDNEWPKDWDPEPVQVVTGDSEPPPEGTSAT